MDSRQYNYYPDHLSALLLAEGADGYVLKQSAPSILINAVRQVWAGHGFLDPAMTGVLMSELAERHRLPDHVKNNVDITARQTSIVRLTAHGYSNKEIATRLDLSMKTVESDKAIAIRKLGLASRVEIIRYAIRQGWMVDN